MKDEDEEDADEVSGEKDSMEPLGEMDQYQLSSKNDSVSQGDDSEKPMEEVSVANMSVGSASKSITQKSSI